MFDSKPTTLWNSPHNHMYVFLRGPAFVLSLLRYRLYTTVDAPNLQMGLLMAVRRKVKPALTAPEKLGIVPRCIEGLFQRMEQQSLAGACLSLFGRRSQGTPVAT